MGCPAIKIVDSRIKMTNYQLNIKRTLSYLEDRPITIDEKNTC